MRIILCRKFVANSFILIFNYLIIKLLCLLKSCFGSRGSQVRILVPRQLKIKEFLNKVTPFFMFFCIINYPYMPLNAPNC